MSYDTRTCPACLGDGRIPDSTGGGHHGVCATCGGLGELRVTSKIPGPLGLLAIEQAKKRAFTRYTTRRSPRGKRPAPRLERAVVRIAADTNPEDLVGRRLIQTTARGSRSATITRVVRELRDLAAEGTVSVEVELSVVGVMPDTTGSSR